MTVDALRRGSVDVLDVLLDQYGRELQRVAFLILHDAAAAEDVVADTLITALERGASLRDTGALRAWLLRIAANHGWAGRSRLDVRGDCGSAGLARVSLSEVERRSADKARLEFVERDLHDPGLDKRLLIHDRLGLFAVVGEEENNAARRLGDPAREHHTALVV
jgi:sigma-70-like protein